jgi:hypothetical protein
VETGSSKAKDDEETTGRRGRGRGGRGDDGTNPTPTSICLLGGLQMQGQNGKGKMGRQEDDDETIGDDEGEKKAPRDIANVSWAFGKFFLLFSCHSFITNNFFRY